MYRKNISHKSLNQCIKAENSTSASEISYNEKCVRKSSASITTAAPSANCVQILCNIVCIHEQSAQLEKSIENAFSANNKACPVIDYLRLYYIEFPKQEISHGFLGKYSNQVRYLYIGSSNVAAIGSAAFGEGIFEKIILENLQLVELHKNIFENLTNTFESLAVIQRNKPINSIRDDFLDHVVHQIKNLTLQVGLPKITNAAVLSGLLQNLSYVNLSYNNFTNTFNDGTFKKMSNVKSLDLSYSNIQFLPDYIFSHFSSSLRHLNLSNNQLLTINNLVFGRYTIHIDLVIDAHSNPWNCSCELRAEMVIIFRYQDNYPTCETPNEYAGLSVLDEGLCAGEFNTTVGNSMSTRLTTEYTTPTSVDALNLLNSTTTSSNALIEPTTSDIMSTMLLQCLSYANETTAEWQSALQPVSQMSITALPNLQVEVILESNNSGVSYGLVWDFYSMTVNYNQYGLGCTGSINYTTIIEDLLPDTAYTFCLVRKDQLTISPFCCESVHLHSNLSVSYNAWLTNDMRSTGISLIIVGVVLCCFVGISGVCMLIKNQPTLLKGSKRVQPTSNNAQDIVIFPKKRSLADLKIKEQTLAKRNSQSSSDISITSHTMRRGSVFSVESSESYANANLYEVIPAYLRLQDIEGDYEKKSLEFASIDSYMPTLATEYKCRDTSLVRYVEIPARIKRVSSDPLPAVPYKQETATLAPAEKASLALQESIPAIQVTDTDGENKVNSYSE
ncbi:uncharacterized protein LOC128867048 [Anastrepha ludens]|uniref:uncharacterized protein LOC128867048 n=1 Tax=Anastrepha ludens TaxID=28586 RepID=UPI0023AEB3D0|nr:uncharacterized protein LOC128867048 [Anastrepha ludens]